jgi:hypothetical protein
MSTKKKPTKKEGAVPSDIKYQDMFTTDPEKIRDYIATSQRYSESIDPDIILKINHKAHKLTDTFDYTQFLGTVTEDEYEMLLQFQNILDNDKRITKILQKKNTSEEDEMYVMNWNTSKYGHFRAMNETEDDYVFDENDFVR